MAGVPRIFEGTVKSGKSGVEGVKIENIVLIGFMGTGKTSVGKRLAKSLGWDFLDTDLAIEEICGVSVSEIFRKHGETRFRSEETVLVKRLLGRKNMVISTGGGTPLNPENWKIFSQIGIIIALYAPIDVILDRIGSKNDRPLLKTGSDEAERLLSIRQPIYNQADLIIDTTELDIDEVVSEILRKVEGRIEDETKD